MAEAVLGQPGGVQPAHELAQLVARQRRLLARLVEQRAGGVGLAASWRPAMLEHVAESDEALLGAVVEVAPDAPALLVGGLDDAHARRGDLGLAGAQHDLVAAALDSAAARAPKIERAARSSTWAPAAGATARRCSRSAARAAAHRHGEIGVQAVAGGEVVLGEARAGALGNADEVVLDDQRARCALDPELEALVQVGAVVADRQHAGALRRVAEHLRHERHLGAEGLREVARERAEEGFARHGRRRRRDRAQQVAATVGRTVRFSLSGERGQEAIYSAARTLAHPAPGASRGTARSSHRGIHQLARPSSSIVAGTSTIRTIVASTRTAAPSRSRTA